VEIRLRTLFAKLVAAVELPTLTVPRSPPTLMITFWPRFCRVRMSALNCASV
jgi:hypothetical protein